MKKFICLLLTSVLFITMSIGIFAYENEYNFLIDGEEITITGAPTEEEAYKIAYIHYCIQNGLEYPCTYASCTHNLETQIVIATTHRASATAPRCQKFRYRITRCTKCTDVTTELLNTWFVECCD